MFAELTETLIPQRAAECLSIREDEIVLSKTSGKEYQMRFLGLVRAHQIIKLSE